MLLPEAIVTVRCKAFCNEGIKENRVLVPAQYKLPISGEIVQENLRVWDSVAGIYTSCHSLTAAAKKKAITLRLQNVTKTN